MIRRTNGVVLLNKTTNRKWAPRVDLLTRHSQIVLLDLPSLLLLLSSFHPSKLIHPPPTRPSCQTPSSTMASPQASSSSPSSFVMYVRHLQEQTLFHQTLGIFAIIQTPARTLLTTLYNTSLSCRPSNWATSTCITHWQHTSDTPSRWNSSVPLHLPPGSPHHPHPPRTVRRRRSWQRIQSSRPERPRRSPGEMPMPFASRPRLVKEIKWADWTHEGATADDDVALFNDFHGHLEGEMIILDSQLVGTFRPFPSILSLRQRCPWPEYITIPTPYAHA